MSKRVGERIKKVRLDSGLSQSRFAEEIGISLPSVTRLEKGGRSPGYEVLLRIVDIFGVNIQWLMTGEGASGADEAKSDLRRLMKLVKSNPTFREKVMSELGLRPSENVTRNKRIYSFLKQQRAEWGEVIELITDIGEEEHIRREKSLRESITYLDVLLSVGTDPD